MDITKLVSNAIASLKNFTFNVSNYRGGFRPRPVGTVADMHGMALWLAQNGYSQRAASYLQSVDPYGALTCTSYLCGVTVISQDLAYSPRTLKLCTGDIDDLDYDSPDCYKEKVVTNTPVARMLNGFVDDGEVTFTEFMQSMTLQALVYGNSLALKSPLGNGVNRLFQLDAGIDASLEVIKFDDGSRRTFMLYNGKRYSITDFFLLKGATLNSYIGYLPAQYIQGAVGLVLRQQKHSERIFDDDATPKVVIHRPIEAGKMDQNALKNFADAWKLWHSEDMKRGVPAIVQEGMQAMPIKFDDELNHLAQARESQVLEVARALQVPAYKLGIVTGLDGAIAQRLSYEYIEQCLVPWSQRWDAAIRRTLLTKEQQYGLGGQLALRMDFRRHAMPGARDKADYFARLMEKGALISNEVRRELGLNPLPGGSNPLVQLNLGPMDKVADGATLTDNTGGANANRNVSRGVGSLTGKNWSTSKATYKGRKVEVHEAFLSNVYHEVDKLFNTNGTDNTVIQ